MKRKIGVKKASFTIEASVVMCMFLVFIGGFLDLAIKLYREDLAQITEYERNAWVQVPQALRIRHLGGELYEEYRLQHNL